MHLPDLLLPDTLTDAELEAAARKIYFEELVPHPPVIPARPWLIPMRIVVAPTEGGFQKLFGKTDGWTGYAHRRTGELCRHRMRRAPWIKPVLELAVAKTKVYVNNHTLGPREFMPAQKPKKNRIFVTTGAHLLYFISLVYIDDGTLALATAFEPDGQWLRGMLKKHGTTCLGPPFPG